MNFEDEEENLKPEKLLIYRKGKEIFDMVHKITALIPENNEYLMEIKGGSGRRAQGSGRINLCVPL